MTRKTLIVCAFNDVLTAGFGDILAITARMAGYCATNYYVFKLSPSGENNSTVCHFCLA